MNAIRNLASILIRPRQTIRRILEQPRDRMVVPLVLLAALSGTLSDVDVGGVRKALQAIQLPWLILLVAVVNVAAMVLLFYGLAGVATLVGRMFEGKGKAREVRSALAWGVAPVIWALLYRLPLALLFPGIGKERFRIGNATVEIPGLDLSTMGLGCALALAELAVLVWSLVLVSSTLGEAHRFSGARGFATLLLTLAAPFVVLIAAVLTIAT